MKRLIMTIGAAAGVFAVSGQGLTYPEARKDNVVDDYFGTKVADPYRWLEDDRSAETLEWVEAQRKVTDDYLSKLPYRAEISAGLKALANFEKPGIPFKKNGKYYYFHNTGLQNQSVLYRTDRLGDPGEVMLDPNALSSDGTVALKSVAFSKDGKYMAYGVSRSGSDWEEIYVMDVATRQLLDDHIEWVKFSGAQWKGDGFYYSTYDQPKSGSAYSGKNEYHKIYYHKIGTKQSEDRLIYVNEKEPLRFYAAATAEKENVFYLEESGVGSGNALYVRPLDDDKAAYKCVNDDHSVACLPVDIVDGKLYLLTNADAPKGRLVAAPLDNPSKANWKDVLPEAADVLSNVSIIDGKLVAVYDKDASNHAYVYTLEGKLLQEIALPAVGTVAVSGEKDEKEMFYSFTSFAYPTTIYKYDIDKNRSEVFSQPSVPFRSEDYVTEQIFFESKDGTKVPMTLTYKKGLKRDGKNPTLIYGYGGFNVTLYPTYSPYRMFLIENGFIYAQVNMRGGNEYGEEWHMAGTQMNKQNVFDDFISAAEYLVKNKYTNPDMLACQGGSNGGLLIGACVNQRPDLYRVAIPQVGVMDMLRYHKFTIGWNWAPDYGTSADSEAMFKYLYAYSPVHNIKNDGTRYPAILVTTADHDDRVVPAHSFKYAATLQAASTGDNPKIIRIDSKAGHGGGKPIAKVIEEYTDIYSFIYYNLGLKPMCVK